MKYVIILFLVLVLAGCYRSIDPQPEIGDIYAIPEIEWRVVGRDELIAVYENSGQTIRSGEELHGFMGYRDGKPVIYTLAPKTVDDQVTLTLGHEVLHVVLGEYH